MRFSYFSSVATIDYVWEISEVQLGTINYRPVGTGAWNGRGPCEDKPDICLAVAFLAPFSQLFRNNPKDSENLVIAAASRASRDLPTPHCFPTHLDVDLSLIQRGKQARPMVVNRLPPLSAILRPIVFPGSALSGPRTSLLGCSPQALAQDTVAAGTVHLYIRGGYSDGEVCWKDVDYWEEKLRIL